MTSPFICDVIMDKPAHTSQRLSKCDRTLVNSYMCRFIPTTEELRRSKILSRLDPLLNIFSKSVVALFKYEH